MKASVCEPVQEPQLVPKLRLFFSVSTSENNLQLLSPGILAGLPEVTILYNIQNGRRYQALQDAAAAGSAIISKFVRRVFRPLSV